MTGVVLQNSYFFSNSSNSYYPVGIGVGYSAAITTEANVLFNWRASGTFSDLYCHVSANSSSSTSTVTLRKNGSSTSLTISIGAALTGTFSDASNSASASPGDQFSILVAQGGSGDIGVAGIGAIFSASSDTKFHWASCSRLTNPTGYYAPGGGASSPSPSQVGVVIPYNMTWSNLSCYVSSNTFSGDREFRSVVNGSDANQVVTIPASTTGLFEDTSNSDSITSSDYICTRFVTLSGSGSQTITSKSSLCVNSSSSCTHVGGGSSLAFSTSSSTTYYNPISGSYTVSLGNATEDNCNPAIPTPASGYSAKRLGIYVASNTGSTDTVLRLRVNGSNGNQSVTCPHGTTGFFEDSLNTDTISSGDAVNYMMTTGTISSFSRYFTQVTFEGAPDPSLLTISADGSLSTVGASTANSVATISASTNASFVGNSLIDTDFSISGSSLLSGSGQSAITTALTISSSSSFSAEGSSTASSSITVSSSSDLSSVGESTADSIMTSNPSVNLSTIGVTVIQAETTFIPSSLLDGFGTVLVPADFSIASSSDLSAIGRRPPNQIMAFSFDDLFSFIGT